MPLKTGCWKLLKVSSCTGCRKRLQEDALSSSELYWMVGIRIKKMGSKAVFRDAFLLFSSHLGLFPIELERRNGKWDGCLYNVIYSRDWIGTKSYFKPSPVHIILKERQIWQNFLLSLGILPWARVSARNFLKWSHSHTATLISECCGQIL